MSKKIFWPTSTLYLLKVVAQMAIMVLLALLFSYFQNVDSIFTWTMAFIFGPLLFSLIFFTNRIIITDDFIEGPWWAAGHGGACRIPMINAEVFYEHKGYCFFFKYDIVIKNKKTHDLIHIYLKDYPKKSAEEIQEIIKKLKEKIN